MTTYLLITSDKPTELTAFVGPKEPIFIPIELDCSNRTDSLNSLRLRDEWDLKMETAKASRLPVVNVSTRDSVLFGLDLDTPVELEGWEVEIVYQYHSSKQFYRNAYWVDCIKDQYDSLKSVGIESIRQAYRLVRSEPVKPNNSPFDLLDLSQCEEAWKKLRRMGWSHEYAEHGIINGKDAEKMFQAGCSHAHSKIEESEREAWNRALDEVADMVSNAFSGRSGDDLAHAEHEIIEELKRLRK